MSYIGVLTLYNRMKKVKWHISSSLPFKGQDAHLHSSAGSTQPIYLQNALHYLPSRATPANLGVKIPGSCQHTHAGWGFDLSALYCYGIAITHLHLSRVKPYQFEARDCSTQATSVLNLVSLEPTTSHTPAKNYTIVPLRLTSSSHIASTAFAKVQ